MLNKIIKYFLENKLVTSIVLVGIVTWGVITAPFHWDTDILPSDPVPVDAIPNIGENQQIVFTEWKGRSPQDIEDQITYPLTTALLGIPGVKSIRSSSVFGFSSIYIIFNEDIEFYWSRSRILEKLNSLSSGVLPDGAQPSLGPDATALGQVYWYTLEGRDKNGNTTGGWDLQELRSVQDFYVKYGLNGAEGVSEVASIGGYVDEYHIDVNPDALENYGIPLSKVVKAVKMSNQDVGAKTIEINKAEYLVRGIGYIEELEDIEKAVVDVVDNTPIRIQDIARVARGPATRRGVLDKDGAEVVGGVVVARYGANPLEVINNVKDQIKEISSGLPKKTLASGKESQLTIVPFYDRTELINETLGTLEEALSLELLITILVVVVMVLNLRASLIISSVLPIAVLMVFIAMRYFGVTANIVALSGIAIAIGTMVDLGVILSENIVKHLRNAKDSGEKLITTIYNASAEVSSAILTAVTTTIVSFIPVFTMEAAEGKLFRPLAFTKTFALLAAVIVVLFIIPTLAHWVFGFKIKRNIKGHVINAFIILLGIAVLFMGYTWAGLTLTALSTSWFIRKYAGRDHFLIRHLTIIVTALAVVWLLAKEWMPLGPSNSTLGNFMFVALLVSIILTLFYLLEYYYSRILNWCLRNKAVFLALPGFVMILGLTIWLGFNTMFGFIATGFDKVGVNIRTTSVWSGLAHTFPGLGEEFMPSLDEGSFLLMPTSMPHAGVEHNKKVVQQLDMLLTNIPEVELAVGKMGRAESALDPAPISMYENIINYKTEYLVDENGHRQRYKTVDGQFVLKTGDTLSNEAAIAKDIKEKHLIPDEDGQYFRNWRQHIQSPDDIWNEIVKVTKIPGVTSAPKLQPIETRLVMLQTGMRAPMGIKVFGPDLKTIEKFGMRLESILKKVPMVKSEAVFADRIVGKPYIHLNIDRDRIGRYGLNVKDIQHVIKTAIGGNTVTSTVEGRERFPVRVRYPRELRDNPERLEKILVPTPTGAQVPLDELLDIEFVKGPQVIKSENTFLTGYVLFDRKEQYSEVEVVEEAQRYIQEKIDNGELEVPPNVSYKFSGDYENQVRAEKRLSIIVPLVLLIIFLILYFQFKSVTTSLMIFMGIAMAFSGAFLLIWCYGQDGFLNFDVLGTNMRDLFQIKTINLSVAVWVGFIALFGIATDDGVLMGTYLDQSFKRNETQSIATVREAVVSAGKRRIKPAIMTSATTIIALLPVLTSTGRGADIMIPMAIPAFGGMIIASITYFIVPVLYSWREELKIKKQAK